MAGYKYGRNQATGSKRHLSPARWSAISVICWRDGATSGLPQLYIASSTVPATRAIPYPYFLIFTQIQSLIRSISAYPPIIACSTPSAPGNTSWNAIQRASPNIKNREIETANPFLTQTDWRISLRFFLPKPQPLEQPFIKSAALGYCGLIAAIRCCNHKGLLCGQSVHRD